MNTTATNPETSSDFAAAIVDAVGWVTFDPEPDEFTTREVGEAFCEIFAGAKIDTFDGAGVMTTNDGVVVTMPSGVEFQITIVRSR